MRQKEKRGNVSKRKCSGPLELSLSYNGWDPLGSHSLSVSSSSLSLCVSLSLSLSLTHTQILVELNFTVKYTNLMCTIQCMHCTTNTPIKTENIFIMVADYFAFPSPQFWSSQRATVLVCFTIVLPALELHINGFIQGVPVSVWIFSLHIMSFWDLSMW